MKIWTDLSSVLSQFTRLTDRRTTAFSSLYRVCIPCSAVKRVNLFRDTVLFHNSVKLAASWCLRIARSLGSGRCLTYRHVDLPGNKILFLSDGRSTPVRRQCCHSRACLGRWSMSLVVQLTRFASTKNRSKIWRWHHYSVFTICSLLSIVGNCTCRP